MKKILLILISLLFITSCTTVSTPKNSKELITQKGKHSKRYRELTTEEKENYIKRMESFLNLETPENEARYLYTHIDGNVEKLKLADSKKFTGGYEESKSSRGYFLRYNSFEDLTSTEFAIKNNDEIYTRSAKGSVGTRTKWDKVNTNPTFKLYDLNIFYDMIKNGDVRFVYNTSSESPVLILDEKYASDILSQYLGFNLNEVKELELKKDKENTLEYIELDLISFVKPPMLEKGLFRGLLKIVFMYSEVHVDFHDYKLGKKDGVDFSRVP